MDTLRHKQSSWSLSSWFHRKCTFYCCLLVMSLFQQLFLIDLIDSSLRFSSFISLAPGCACTLPYLSHYQLDVSLVPSLHLRQLISHANMLTLMCSLLPIVFPEGLTLLLKTTPSIYMDTASQSAISASLEETIILLVQALFLVTSERKTDICHISH